jgi:hypothetical protein
VPSAARDRHQLEQYYSTASLSLMLFSAFKIKLRTSLPRSADDSFYCPLQNTLHTALHIWLGYSPLFHMHVILAEASALGTADVIMANYAIVDAPWACDAAR